MKMNLVSEDYEKFKKQLLADPEVSQEYKALEDEFDLITKHLKAQKNA